MISTIYFSDKSTLSIKESDSLTPIVPLVCDDEKTASMGKPVTIYSHIQNGLIPSLMEIFCNCDYFILNYDYSTAYCSKSIVKIETEL